MCVGIEFHLPMTLMEKADCPKAVLLNCGTQSPRIDALVLPALPLLGQDRHSTRGGGARL